MKTINGEVIWITGASSGIGQQLAIKLADAGNTVIISARNQQTLEAMAQQHSNMVPLPFDVSDHHSLPVVALQLTSISEHLDRVIINAGNCEYLDLNQPDWSMMERIMKINFLGAVNTVELALPLLKNSRLRPHIVGVVSLATALPFARAEAYGASKAALQYFLDALRVDLVPSGIDVTVINPGFVKTPLTDKNGFDMPFIISSERAAERMVGAINKRPYEYNFPGRLYYLLKLLNLFPRFWAKYASPKINQQA